MNFPAARQNNMWLSWFNMNHGEHKDVLIESADPKSFASAFKEWAETWQNQFI